MNHSIKISRFPQDQNRSLRAWSAADEYILKYFNENSSRSQSIAIINDRFGYLTHQLHRSQPHSISHFKSQEDAIEFNHKANHLDSTSYSTSRFLASQNTQFDWILLKIPKSMELFHFFMIKVHALSSPESTICCGFMTKYFTQKMLTFASQYFENVSQSLAHKKSRLLILSKPKVDINEVSPIKTIEYVAPNGDTWKMKQYYGVFSSNHIDYATQFLLQNLELDPNAHKILDLASGNGIIAHQIRVKLKEAEIHLMDDSHLALESSKLNLSSGNNCFHYAHNLDHLEEEYFDVIVCNPPFHFEHENTIDIALQLFKGASRVLKKNGIFTIVSNLHLNYKTHLSKIFRSVEVVNMNAKFEIIKCKKISS